MRSVITRCFSPLFSSFVVGAAVVGVASIASAAPHTQVVNDREGRAWLHVGAPQTTGAIDARARATASTVSPLAARLMTSLVMTSRDTFGDGDTIVHFAQTHTVRTAQGATRSVPVIGRGVAVRLAADPAKTVTNVELEDGLASMTARLDEAAAATAASQRLAWPVDAKDAHLIVWPLREGGAALAYAVLPRMPASIGVAPRVIVDATTGAILEARDMRHFAKARMYQANPTSTPSLELLDLAITPNADGLNSDWIVSNNCIDNKVVKAVDFQGFKANVHVCDLTQTAKPNADGNFVYEPQDVEGSPEARKDEFAEVSMYFHATKAYRFFRDLQGNPDAQVVADKPLPVVANLQLPAGITKGDLTAAADPNRALEPFQNAFFSPAAGGLGAIFGQLYGISTGALWFGQGPRRDYAYDGDVIYHEFTHAVVDVTLRLEAYHLDARGVIDAPGAMNEGLADYFSSALAGDPNVGEYASKDISQNLGVIRTLDNQDKCPTSIDGEVHNDSTLFSGGLWEARTSLPEGDRSKFDAALYKAMRTANGKGDYGYEDVVKLFQTTLDTDLPSGSAALKKAMERRGVLPFCERILEASATPVKAAGGRGFSSPGMALVGMAGFGPGIVQFHSKLGPTPTATIKFTTQDSPGAGGPFGGGTPFKPVILVKFGKPITWALPTKTMKSPHDADLVTALDSGAAIVDVPEGATDIYVQVANKGDNDGSYDAVTIEGEPVMTTQPPVTTPPPSTPAPADDAGDSLEGGGCSTPSRSDGSFAAFAGLALAGAVALRRRRNARGGRE